MLAEMGADVYYINSNSNIRYLTDFSGSSAYVLISKDKNYFITDFRYKEQSAEQVKGFDIRISYQQMDEIKKILEELHAKSVVFESTHVSYNYFEKLQDAFPGIKFIPAADKIETLTMCKTPGEIARLKKAVEISDKTFDKILGIIKPGMKESEVAAEITYWHKKFGASKDSFDSIVASGWRGALPHGIASDKVIEKGEMVTLDFGCVYEGFCSDITRTVAVGGPSEQMKKIYQIVLDSQLKAIDAVKTGALTKDIDNAARDYIKSFGYGDNFGHGTGHGLGILVHEMPSVSQRMEMNLPENVVITIEPGIYLDGIGGVRIEDDVMTVNGSCEVLNKAPKELIMI